MHCRRRRRPSCLSFSAAIIRRRAPAAKMRAAAERDPDLLLLHCDEDLNDCEWSSMLAPAATTTTPKPAESDSSNQQQPDDPKLDQQPAREEDEAETKKPSCQDNGNGAVIKPQTELQKKEHPLYSLRRNPKRSRRFIDHEYSLDGILPAPGQLPAPAPVSSPVHQALPSTKKNTGFSDTGVNNGRGGNATTIPTPAGSSSTPATTTAPERARACTECGKEFSSWKALFGHMRCHPEREWRGIQRPENLSEYKISSRPSVRRSSKKARQHQHQQARVVARPVLLEEHEELETMYIKLVASDNESDTESIEAAYINGSCNSSGGFNSSRCRRIVTGKRSKRSRQQQQQQLMVSNSSSLQMELSSPAQAEFKEESLDMARCLVMLACAGRSLGGGNGYKDGAVADLGPDNGNDEEEGTSTTNDIVQNEKQADVPSGSSNEIELEEEDEEVMGIVNNAGQQEEEEEEDEEEERMDQQKQDEQDFVHLGSSVSKVEPGELMFNGPAELLDQQDLESIRMKYECSTCKRIFKSHQALGGHRASHKKVKGCFAKTNLNNLSEVILVHHIQDVDDEASTMNLDAEFLKSDEKLLPSDFMDQQPPMLSSLSTFSALQAHHLQQHHHHHHHHHLPQLQQQSYYSYEMFNFSRHRKDLEMLDWTTTSSTSSSRKLVSNSLKGHKCSICHRVFTSGQALGGHKRCHWGGTEQRPVAEALLSSSSNGSKTIQLHQQQVEQSNPPPNNAVAVLRNSPNAGEEFVGLNLPALVAEDEDDEELENAEEREGCVAVLSNVAIRECNEDDNDELAKAAPDEEQDKVACTDDDAQEQQEAKMMTSFHDEDLYKQASAAFSPCRVLETLPLSCI